MTKRWKAPKSGGSQTKQQASKRKRAKLKTATRKAVEDDGPTMSALIFRLHNRKNDEDAAQAAHWLAIMRHTIVALEGLVRNYNGRDLRNFDVSK